MNKRDILKSTQRELNEYKGSWPEIARRAEVSYSWLIKIMNGNTANPRIQELQRVVDVLLDLNKAEHRKKK